MRAVGGRVPRRNSSRISRVFARGLIARARVRAGLVRDARSRDSRGGHSLSTEQGGRFLWIHITRVGTLLLKLLFREYENALLGRYESPYS